MKEIHLRDDVLNHQWRGEGTTLDPYLVEFLPYDPENPMNFSSFRKWLYTFVAFISVFDVTFLSSTYSGTTLQLRDEFHSSSEVTTLGVALFVLGFAIGPALW
jgi:hypothetical protein